MNSLPRIHDDREHKQWTKVLKVVMDIRAFDTTNWSSAGRFLGELAKRIEEYEKLRWPIRPPTKAEARKFRREQESIPKPRKKRTR